MEMMPSNGCGGAAALGGDCMPKGNLNPSCRSFPPSPINTRPNDKRRCPHLPQHVPSRPSNSGSSLISRRTMTSIAFPSPAPRFPYVPRVPGSGEDVWHRGVSWQSCLVVGIGDWPRTSHRAREWYSSLGIFPQASDIRFVKLYMLAISAISQQATSERPKLFRWSRSWGEHSRGSFVILTA